MIKDFYNRLPVPIISMQMEISLTFNDGGYERFDIVKEIINLGMCRFSSMAKDTNFLLGIQPETESLFVVNIWAA